MNPAERAVKLGEDFLVRNGAKRIMGHTIRFPDATRNTIEIVVRGSIIPSVRAIRCIVIIDEHGRTIPPVLIARGEKRAHGKALSLEAMQERRRRRRHKKGQKAQATNGENA